jgi:hypothetical protein
VFVDQKPRLTFPNGTVRHRGGGVRVVEFPAGVSPRVGLPRGKARAIAPPPEAVHNPNAPLERCTVQ